MFLIYNKKLLINLLIFLITFLTPVLTKATTTQPSTTTQRIKRPITSQVTISETQKIKNITKPRIIERTIESSTSVATSKLPKIVSTSKPTRITKSPTKITTTPHILDEKSKNFETYTKNSTDIQLMQSFSNFNHTDEFRVKQLNEKNFTQSTTTIMPFLSSPPVISSISNSIPIANNLDFYLDPINADTTDEQIASINEVTNLTQGFDSYLINENINAFTSGTTLCPKCKCGVKTLKKIVGGDITIRNEYPWTALLTYNEQFFCAGSLINNLYVVTAAHCTTTFKKNQILVHFQDTTKDGEKSWEIITRKVTNIYRPLHFNQNTFFNDISLLKLSEPVDISNGLIRPICLPIDKTSFVGKIGTITGWRINRQNSVALQVSRLVNTTILSNRQCRKTLVGKLITPTMICSITSKPNQGSECRGDSGGPLMVTQKGRSRLAGVVSWGLGCTKKNAADVFTRTTKFNGWLRKLSQNACWCN